MLKITFTPEFLEWVGQKMRANDTGLDGEQFAREFMHRAIVARGADVRAALIDENERLRTALKELVKAADPRTNMSDIPLLDALSVARAAIARVEGGE